MNEWADAVPIIAAVIGAAASVGILIVAVVGLSSRFVSKAIDKQGMLLEKHEKKNADEHAGLGKRIDRVENKIDHVENKIDHVESKIDAVKDLLHEVRTVVGRLDERQQAAEKRERERGERGE